MGSSKKPAKKNDRPIISTPRTKGSGPGGGGGQKTFDLNQMCPVHFDVPLKQHPFLRVRSDLHIDDRGKVLLAGQEIGALTAQQFRKVAECAEHGYVYLGSVVVGKNKNFYGRFERIST